MSGSEGKSIEGILNPTDMSTLEVAELEDSGKILPLSLAEVSEVVNKLLSSKAPGVDETHPEILKVLDIVGPLQCQVDGADWGWQFPFLKKGGEGVLQLLGHCTAQAPRKSSCRR